jgi:hypothetical protein
MAVTYSRYKFITASLPKRSRNGRFTSETAVWRFQKWNRHLDPEVVKNPLELLESSIVYTKVFQGGGDGRGYRNICINALRL